MSTIVHIAVSTMADGSMSKAVSGDVRDRNRRQFLLANNIRPEQTVLVWVTYDGEEYCRYSTVGKEAAGKGIVYGDARLHGAALRVYAV